MNTDLQTDLGEDQAEEKQKLNLEVQVKETSACERHVTVTIPREDIDRYFSDKFDELMPQAEVPGFRVGKAPRQLIENRFRKQVADQVKGSLLMDSLAQINDDQDFSAISEPDFDFETIKIPDEGPLTFEFDIEVRPEFDVPNWKGLQLERIEHEFSEEEIDREFEVLMGQFADLVPVDEPAQSGDHIITNLTVRHGGQKVSEFNEISVQLLPKLSFSDAQIDGFGESMSGIKADEKRALTTTISEHSSNDELKGEEVELEFEVLDVKRIDLGDRDDIAKKFGMENADEVRTFLASSMQSRLAYRQRQEIRQQISASLTESADWELPADLLKRQSKRELDRAVMEMRSSGFSEAQILAQQNQLRQNVLHRTEAMLKEHFILERIAEDEQVEELPEDYDREIAKIAEQRNDSVRRVRAQIERSGQMDALRNMIIEQKVIDMITDQANFSSKAYESDNDHDTCAVDLSISGKDTSDIPEARYDDVPGESLPTKTDERD